MSEIIETGSTLIDIEKRILLPWKSVLIKPIRSEDAFLKYSDEKT